MINEDVIRKNVSNTIKDTDFPELGEKYKGKVRDNYTDHANSRRTIIATDRLSAFDVVLGTIPFKGQVLNQLAADWFEKTRDVAMSHFIESPDPNVMVVQLCKPFPVEVIVRKYITGSLWREYEKGEDNYDLDLPSDVKKDQRFPKPIITPSTKAEEGHDMPMKREEVLKIIPEEKYKKMEDMALRLFEFGTKVSEDEGLILVDTKYEFGENADGEILVIDEIHTPDSSRYWIKESYEELFAKGQPQQMLDKEYVRQWLIKKDYMGDGEAPELSEDVIVTAAKKYIELYETITQKEFKVVEGDVKERIAANLAQNSGGNDGQA